MDPTFFPPSSIFYSSSSHTSFSKYNYTANVSLYLFLLQVLGFPWFLITSWFMTNVVISINSQVTLNLWVVMKLTPLLFTTWQKKKVVDSLKINPHQTLSTITNFNKSPSTIIKTLKSTNPNYHHSPKPTPPPSSIAILTIRRLWCHWWSNMTKTPHPTPSTQCRNHHKSNPAGQNPYPHCHFDSILIL